ncbi:MAG: dienelactone hydrolase family protein, partial [Pirellula sp.]|nr:dienelactone hydrolase family protein [Pirellula sp.]
NIGGNLPGILASIAAALLSFLYPNGLSAQTSNPRLRSDPTRIESSWDDLLEGVKTAEDWAKHRVLLKQRYLELIRDQHKPTKVPLDLKVQEEMEIDGIYRRFYISYQVEAEERAHAYLGIPIALSGKAPAVVALHGTTADGTKQTAGINGNPDKAFLDHLCRRGYIVIAPEHFVSGERIPSAGPYDTTAFHTKHPEWTAVGKFNFEHSIAVDVLLAREDVDAENIGVMGHSLGGHGSYYLAAYDDRLKACACNCGASFFRHNQHVEDWSRDKWYVYLKPIRPLLLKGELPNIDMHEIIALIAPRAYLDVSALNDGVPLTQRQRALMHLKIADVYDLIGKPENFSFFIHGRGHALPHDSRELIYGFLDFHLKPIESTQTKLIGR